MNADGNIWEKIKIGDIASFKVFVGRDKVTDFVSLSGDKNPIHFDEEVAKKRGLRGPISHGMLLALYFSTLVGEYFLKDHNLYLSQDINFIKSVFIGETITVKGRVINKIESLHILEIGTVIVNKNGEEVVRGSARVKYI